MLRTIQGTLQDLITSGTAALWLRFVVERLQWDEVAGSAWQKVRFLRLGESSRRQRCVDVSDMCPLRRQSYGNLGPRWVILGWNAGRSDRFITSCYCLVSPDKPRCSTPKQVWSFPCTSVTFITHYSCHHSAPCVLSHLQRRQKTVYKFATFRVLKTILMKVTVLGDATPCRLVNEYRSCKRT